MLSLAVVLEGGGAKCAYQAGALRALAEENIIFNGIGGTSYGSFNAAMYIAGGVRRVNSFWQNLKPSMMFQDEALDDLMDKIYNKESFLDKNTVQHVIKEWKHAYTKYMDTSELYHQVVLQNVDEEAVRKSKMNFGLVTIQFCPIKKLLLKAGANFLTGGLYSISDQFVNKDKSFMENFFEGKVLKYTKDEIPNGRLAEFVLASASIPPFKPIEFDGHAYLDGGMIDNCPVRLMSRYGYKKFLVIRTNQKEKEPLQDLDADWEVFEVSPSEELGSCALFSKQNIEHLIELGYKDTKEYLVEHRMEIMFD